MQAGLYDILRGQFADGQRIEDVHESFHLELSIVSNLSYLFNTRRGSLPHLEDYGLPDVTEIYRDIPDSIVRLQGAIRAAIEKFEPRVRRVRVEHHHTDPYAMRLVFLIHGELMNRQRIRFETTFSSNEAANVRPLRQPT